VKEESTQLKKQLFSTLAVLFYFPKYLESLRIYFCFSNCHTILHDASIGSLLSLAHNCLFLPFPSITQQFIIFLINGKDHHYLLCGTPRIWYTCKICEMRVNLHLYLKNCLLQYLKKVLSHRILCCLKIPCYICKEDTCF
jgi:hypothetical protein